MGQRNLTNGILLAFTAVVPFVYSISVGNRTHHPLSCIPISKQGSQQTCNRYQSPVYTFERCRIYGDLHRLLGMHVLHARPVGSGKVFTTVEKYLAHCVGITSPPLLYSYQQAGKPADMRQVSIDCVQVRKMRTLRWSAPPVGHARASRKSRRIRKSFHDSREITST